MNVTSSRTIALLSTRQVRPGIADVDSCASSFLDAIKYRIFKQANSLERVLIATAYALFCKIQAKKKKKNSVFNLNVAQSKVMSNKNALPCKNGMSCYRPG